MSSNKEFFIGIVAVGHKQIMPLSDKDGWNNNLIEFNGRVATDHIYHAKLSNHLCCWETEECIGTLQIDHVIWDEWKNTFLEQYADQIQLLKECYESVTIEKRAVIYYN